MAPSQTLGSRYYEKRGFTVPTPMIETLRHMNGVGVFADAAVGSFGQAALAGR